jgi:hypothetical protein
MTTKAELLKSITNSVRQKHPWHISQEKYLTVFKELPRAYLDERLAYDNLLEKCKQFKLCHLVLSEVKVEIKLNLDELIIWELSLDKWAEARAHNIVPGDIKKLLKECE